MGDINVSRWDYVEFKARMAQPNPHLLAKRLIELGLAGVVSFPPTIQHYEFLLECASHYDRGTQRVIGPQGRVLANFSLVSMAQNFYMPKRSHVVPLDLEVTKTYFEDDSSKTL